MGGHGALTIALKNPTLFKSVSAFAPICNPKQCPWGQKVINLPYPSPPYRHLPSHTPVATTSPILNRPWELTSLTPLKPMTTTLAHSSQHTENPWSQCMMIS